MIGKLKNLTVNQDGSQNITITVPFDFREEFDALKDKELSIEIKKLNRHRSMDANSFFWHLCGEIAKRSSKFSTQSKTDIYREAIRAKGVYEPLIVRKNAVDRFINRWKEKGEGWFVDVMDDYHSNYKVLHAYYGSSTYDSMEMSRIIDYVVEIARDLGIPTMTENELIKLLGRWKEKKDEE